MRKLVFITVMLVILATVMFSNEVLKLAIGEYPPYTSEENMDGKIAEEIVREAFAEEGYVVEFAYYPWKRAYEMVKEGNAVGTFPWLTNEERDSIFIIPEEPLYEIKEVFFHLKNLDFDWDDFEDLKPYKIGGTTGYAHVELLTPKGIELDITSSDENNLKKLAAGRIDLFPISFVSGYYMINKLFSPERAALFTNNPKALNVDNHYLFLSGELPESEKLAEAFNKGLRKIKESGKYDAIFDKYIGID